MIKSGIVTSTVYTRLLVRIVHVGGQCSPFGEVVMIVGDLAAKNVRVRRRKGGQIISGKSVNCSDGERGRSGKVYGWMEETR